MRYGAELLWGTDAQSSELKALLCGRWGGTVRVAGRLAYEMSRRRTWGGTLRRWPESLFRSSDGPARKVENAVMPTVPRPHRRRAAIPGGMPARLATSVLGRRT